MNQQIKTVKIQRSMWTTDGGWNRRLNSEISKMARRGYSYVDVKRTSPNGVLWIAYFEKDKGSTPLQTSRPPLDATEEGVAAATTSAGPAAPVPGSIGPPFRLFNASGDSVWTALHDFIAAGGHDLVTSDMPHGHVTFSTHMSSFSPGERYDVYVKADGDHIRMSVVGAKRNAFTALQPVRIKKITARLFDEVEAKVGGLPRAPWSQPDSA